MGVRPRRRVKRATDSRVMPVKKQRKAPRPFVVADALRLALVTLAEPPKRSTIVRRDPVGELVARWVLPLDCAPTGNAQLKLARNSPFAVEKLKKRVLSMMLQQSQGRRAMRPLPGRPHVRVVIFTSGREDYDRGRTKLIVDRLQRGRHPRPDAIPLEQWRQIEPTMPPRELGWLRDDTVEAIDLATWQEPAPPGKGCALVELYTGEAR